MESTMKKATQSPGQSVGRTTAKRIYIYGVVPNFYGTTQFQLLENSGVYAITFNNISAIVSESDGTHIEHLDRESLGYLLVHHQKTIEELQNKGFTMIIPMKLGTIVDSKDDVIKILSNGYGLIIETLKKIEYLTEIDMVVTWANFADVLKGIAQLEDVKELKKDIMKDNGVITKIDQVKMGLFLKEKIDQNKLRNRHDWRSTQHSGARTEAGHCIHPTRHPRRRDPVLHWHSSVATEDARAH